MPLEKNRFFNQKRFFYMVQPASVTAFAHNAYDCYNRLWRILKKTDYVLMQKCYLHLQT